MKCIGSMAIAGLVAISTGCADRSARILAELENTRRRVDILTGEVDGWKAKAEKRDNELIEAAAHLESKQATISELTARIDELTAQIDAAASPVDCADELAALKSHAQAHINRLLNEIATRDATIAQMNAAAYQEIEQRIQASRDAAMTPKRSAPAPVAAPPPDPVGKRGVHITGRSCSIPNHGCGLPPPR